MFCYYGDITGTAHCVDGQCFPLPHLWASGLPSTHAHGTKLDSD